MSREPPRLTGEGWGVEGEETTDLCAEERGRKMCCFRSVRWSARGLHRSWARPGSVKRLCHVLASPHHGRQGDAVTVLIQVGYLGLEGDEFPKPHERDLSFGIWLQQVLARVSFRGSGTRTGWGRGAEGAGRPGQCVSHHDPLPAGGRESPARLTSREQHAAWVNLEVVARLQHAAAYVKHRWAGASREEEGRPQEPAQRGTLGLSDRGGNPRGGNQPRAGRALGQLRQPPAPLPGFSH